MSEDWKFQLSKKFGDTMINIRADNPAEFAQSVDAVQVNLPAILAFGDIETAVSTIAAVTGFTPTPAAVPQQSPSLPAHAIQQYQQPQQQNTPPVAPMCNCGQPKKWVPPGVSKATGAAYQGFHSCPQPRGQQCGK